MTAVWAPCGSCTTWGSATSLSHTPATHPGRRQQQSYAINHTEKCTHTYDCSKVSVTQVPACVCVCVCVCVYVRGFVSLRSGKLNIHTLCVFCLYFNFFSVPLKWLTLSTLMCICAKFTTKSFYFFIIIFLFHLFIFIYLLHFCAEGRHVHALP